MFCRPSRLFWVVLEASAADGRGKSRVARVVLSVGGWMVACTIPLAVQRRRLQLDPDRNTPQIP